MTKQDKKELLTFGMLTLGVGLLLGIIVGGWLYSGPSTGQVQAIYDLGRLGRCWNCFQPVSKDAPAGVIRFHGDAKCLAEGKPW